MKETKLSPESIEFLKLYGEMFGRIPISVVKSCYEVQRKLDEDNKNK